MYFFPFGALGEVFRVFVPISTSSWELGGGSCYPFFITVPISSCL